MPSSWGKNISCIRNFHRLTKKYQDWYSSNKFFASVGVVIFKTNCHTCIYFGVSNWHVCIFSYRGISRFFNPHQIFLLPYHTCLLMMQMRPIPEFIYEVKNPNDVHKCSWGRQYGARWGAVVSVCTCVSEEHTCSIDLRAVALHRIYFNSAIFDLCKASTTSWLPIKTNTLVFIPHASKVNADWTSGLDSHACRHITGKSFVCDIWKIQADASFTGTVNLRFDTDQQVQPPVI